jgi:hypothetical protein
MNIDMLLQKKNYAMLRQTDIVNTLIENNIKLIITTQNETDMIFRIPYNVCGTLIRDMPLFKNNVIAKLREKKYFVKSLEDNIIYVNWHVKLCEAKRKSEQQLKLQEET